MEHEHMICECGYKIQKRSLPMHIKTKRHRLWCERNIKEKDLVKIDAKIERCLSERDENKVETPPTRRGKQQQSINPKVEFALLSLILLMLILLLFTR